MRAAASTDEVRLDLDTGKGIKLGEKERRQRRDDLQVDKKPRSGEVWSMLQTATMRCK